MQHEMIQILAVPCNIVELQPLATSARTPVCINVQGLMTSADTLRSLTCIFSERVVDGCSGREPSCLAILSVSVPRREILRLKIRKCGYAAGVE